MILSLTFSCIKMIDLIQSQRSHITRQLWVLMIRNLCIKTEKRNLKVKVKTVSETYPDEVM